MNGKLLGTIVVMFFYSSVSAQIEKDTANIQEVVVTGQFKPQSIKKSIYKVEVITAEDIKRMALNNIAEVLNQSLNILIISDKNSGNSKANIMGLNAEYTKILIDNIPIIGDTGLGSNIDLTKLSLDNVERIEILKGSMGVEYGNNAVAGVLNIITKKSSQKKWKINGFMQEETVGKEYDWVEKGRGRHIQSLDIGHKISDKWYVNAFINRNDFQGFRGTQQGRNYFEKDGLRGYEWQPKEQLNTGALLKYTSAKTQLFYKAEFLNEEINYYNPVVTVKPLGGAEQTFTALDRDYNTTRILQHFNIMTSLFDKINYIGDFSYQKQERKSQDYLYDIPARNEISKEEKLPYYSSETYYSRGTFNGFTNKEKFDLQAGYEGDYTKGFAGNIAGKFNNDNVERKIGNLGVFTSGEFSLSDNWFLRPGIRASFSDKFKTLLNYSFVLKNKINEHSDFRAVVGTANRYPTFEELYTYFVDANHDVQGNEDLKPEIAYSGTLVYNLANKNNQIWKWNIDASTMYLQVKDRIDFAQIDGSPSHLRYININSYQSWLNSVSGKIGNKNFGFNAGISLTNISRKINSETEELSKTTLEANAGANYTLQKTKTTFSVYYKYFGKSINLSEDTSLGITQYLPTEANDFSLMDFSILQNFWGNRFNLTFGVRNIFDVTTVNSVSLSSGSHGGTTNSQGYFYGRSYFARIGFNF